ncbi:MAG: DUF1738 domain-containing protein [Fusobacterium sp.]|nr:DUF1738 domain-containing protein [Fusobacterium sp.]
MVRAIDIISEDRKKVVENIIERIEKDGLEWKKGWSPEMVAPTNPSSKAEYKGRNVVKAFNSALNNEYKDPRWITFKQADKEGWKVKKGAKSIVLEKWIFDKEEKRLNPETGREEKIKVKLDRPVPNYFRVFNGQDIEGMPPLNIKPLDKNETLEIAENIIKSSKVPVVEIAQPSAYYSSSENRIVMPLRNTFKSQESYLATALHEMVHSTKKELGREQSKTRGDEIYAKEELVAELGSLMLQGKLGIKLENRHVDNHAAYLQGWIKVLKNDSNELFRAAEKAEKASELLYERYQEYVKEHNLDIEKENISENSQEEEKRELNPQELLHKSFIIKSPEKNSEGFIVGIDKGTQKIITFYENNPRKWKQVIQDFDYLRQIGKEDGDHCILSIRNHQDKTIKNKIEKYNEFLVEHGKEFSECKPYKGKNITLNEIQKMADKESYLKINFIEVGMPNREKYLGQILTKNMLKELESLDKSLSEKPLSEENPNKYFKVEFGVAKGGNLIPSVHEMSLGNKFSREENKETFKRVEEEFQLMENRKNIKNNETFKYYSIERKLNVGNYPVENLIRVGRFDDKLNVNYTENKAWGTVEYTSPLTDYQQKEFKLTSEEEISKIKIAGYEFKNSQEVSKAISDEKYILSSDRVVDIYFNDTKRVFISKTIYSKQKGAPPIVKKFLQLTKTISIDFVEKRFLI